MGGRDLYTNIVEALPTAEPPKYMAIHCAAADRCVLLKKKEKKRKER